MDLVISGLQKYLPDTPALDGVHFPAVDHHREILMIECHVGIPIYGDGTFTQ
jgi:hypothetical protein